MLHENNCLYLKFHKRKFPMSHQCQSKTKTGKLKKEFHTSKSGIFITTKPTHSDTRYLHSTNPNLIEVVFELKYILSMFHLLHFLRGVYGAHCAQRYSCFHIPLCQWRSGIRSKTNMKNMIKIYEIIRPCSNYTYIIFYNILRKSIFRKLL